MDKKNNLLSIGEVAKLTGASIYSLRYYEKIKILEPVFIDPDSGYRYYSFDQTHLIEIIMLCIELDIPLKEFAKFTDPDDTMDFRAFLGYGRKLAEEKLKVLKKGLKLIGALERQMDLVDFHEAEEIYTRTLPEKFFYVKPCGGPLKGLDLLGLFELFSDIPFPDDGYSTLPEYGFLREATQSGTSFHAFIEVPRRMSKKGTVKVPAGTYMCRQSEDTQIEQSADIFGTYLSGKKSYLAIETEIFIGKHKLSKPLNEVRVIATDSHLL